MMKTFIPIACVVLMAYGLVAQVRQDTTNADTSTIKALKSDSLRTPVPPTAIKPKAAYKVDTTFEAVNLERYYYGMDGIDGAFDYNPWEEFLFQDADGREEDERDQRDQERDTRE